MPTNKVSVSFKSQKDRHLITTLEDFARAINSLVDESGGSGTSGETKVVSSVKGWYDTIYPLGGGGKLDQKRDLFIHPGRKYEMLTGDAAGLKWGWENFCTSVGLEAGPLGAGEYNTHLGFRAGREELNGEANTFLGALAGYNSGATTPMDEDAETVTWSLAVNTTASATPALFSTGDRLYYCRRNTSSEGELLYSEDGVDFTNSVTTFTAPNTMALTGFFTFIIEYKGSLFWNSYGDSSNIQEWNGSSVTNHLNVNNYHAASAHVFNNKLWVCTTVTPFVNDNDIIVYYYDGTSWTAVTDYDGAAHFSDDCNSADIALNHGHQLHRWIEYNSSLYLIVERWTGGTTWTTHVLKWDGTSAFDTVATITVSGDAYAHVTAGVWLGSTYYLFLSRFESNGSIKNTLADRRVYVYTSSNMTTWTHVGTISGDISFAADAILWDGRLMIAGVNYTTQDTSVGRLDMSDYTLTEEALVDINTHCRFFVPFMGRLFLSGYDIYGQNKGCIYERENLIADDIVAATPANVMIGAAAGWSNVTGQHNVIIGALADVATSDLDNAIAIGYMAKVAKSNVMALGGTGDYAVNVAIGKVTADYALDVLGSARVSSQFISTLATGTKPIDVTSTTLCTNLNADKWEGYDLSVSGLADKDLMMYSTGSSAWVNASLLGIEDLTDPGADRIMFWDDSAGYVTWLSVDGTSLGITDTTIAVIPGGIDHGSLAGLGDNDHTQYVLHSLDTSEGGILVGTGIGAFTYLARGTEGQVLYCDDETALWGDHGTIAGLGDDDHPQYINHNLMTADKDFLVGDGLAGFAKKTLAETGAILEADINHDNLVGFVAAEHYDWTNETHNLLTTGSITLGTNLIFNSADPSILKGSDSAGSLSAYSSATANKGPKVQMFNAAHATYPGNMYIDYGDYTAAAAAGAAIYIRAMNNSALLDAIKCTIGGKVLVGGGGTVGDGHIACNSRAVVYRSSDQTITTATLTQIQWNAEVSDPGGDFASYQYTCPIAGLYAITANAIWNGKSTGNLAYMQIRVAGTAIAESTCYTGAYASMNCSTIYPLAAAQVVDVVVYHTEGSNLNILGGIAYTNFSVALIQQNV